jgi:hypothetical protein
VNRGERDYAALPNTIPSWLGDWAPMGDGGTYNQLNGGAVSIAGSAWVIWVLRGDAVAGQVVSTQG